MISDSFSLVRTVAVDSLDSVALKGFGFREKNGRTSYTKYLTFYVVSAGVDPTRTVLASGRYDIGVCLEPKWRVFCQVLLTPETIQRFKGSLELRDWYNVSERASLKDLLLGSISLRRALVNPENVTPHMLSLLKDDARVIMQSLEPQHGRRLLDMNFANFFEKYGRVEGSPRLEYER